MADRVDVSGGATLTKGKHWWQHAGAETREVWTPETLPAPSPVVIRAERV